MVAAFPLPAEERILLRHCGGIVPPLFSSDITDNATHQRASSKYIGKFTQVPLDCTRLTSATSLVRRF
jgi:hypothetical protein